MGRAKPYAPYPISYDKEHGRRVHRITCECGATDETATAAQKGLPVDKLAKTFGHRGWELDRTELGRGTCPACLEAAKKPKAKPVLALVRPASQEEPVKKIVTPLPEMVSLTGQSTTVTKPEPPKAMGLDEMLLVLDAVEGVYEPKTGYKEGYSDKRISDELNCPLDWVRQVRTKKFGNLPETLATAELRGLIDKAMKRVDTLKQSLAFSEKDTDDFIDRAKASFAKKHAELRERIDSLDLHVSTLQRRLDDLINGKD